MSSETVIHTELPLEIVNKGKVRDIYEINNDLLLVVTDRISAFDYVLPNPIPSKGICLTQLSKFWFEYTKDMVPNHMISTTLDDYPKILQDYSEQLKYRSMIVKKTKVIPIECIVRGYISGSAWKSYKKDGTVCGIKMSSDLQESEQFSEPLFTPSTKADTGHDINISFEKMVELVGKDVSEQLNDYSLKLYNTAAEYARKRGIIIADTKSLTPDSSRFWPVEKYDPGKSQPSFDKQFVRDYLSTTSWDKNSPPPQLPEEVIAETQRKYQEAYEKITGEKFLFI
jgi:phosphoribosylaminoimidazole-succinocarboxamide synthase